MLCRVEMPTNEQTYGRFYRWKLLNQGGTASKVIFLALPVLLLVFAVWAFLSSGSWLPMILFAISLAYTIFSLYIRPGQEFKRRGGAALETEIYIFTETGFVRNVRSEESGQMDHTSQQYDVLVKAVETKQDFYLFYGPNTAYLVDKEYFTNGTAEDLRTVLTKKLQGKFTSKS